MVNRSWANKDTHLPPEGGQQIPPARAEPPVQSAKLIGDMKGASRHPAPRSLPEDGGHPGLVAPSSQAAAGAWAVVGPLHRAACAGHLRSPAPALLPRAAPRPQGRARKGSAHLRAPPAFAALELFLYLISSHYGQLTYFSRAHECPKHKPGAITHHCELRRNPSREVVSESSC